MRKHGLLYVSILVLIMILAGCNTSDQTNIDNDQDSQQQESSQANVEGKNEIATKEINEVETEQQNKLKTEQQSKSEMNQQNDFNQTIQYTSNGQEVSENTSLIESEQQNYAIQVLPKFSLVMEEPGRDMLVYEPNDALFMRIETYSTDNASFEHIAENAEQTIKAVNHEYQVFDIEQYTKSISDIQEAVAHEATIDSDKVITVTFLKNEIITKLTIFDNSSVDLSDAFIKMGLTIQEK